MALLRKYSAAAVYCTVLRGARGGGRHHSPSNVLVTDSRQCVTRAPHCAARVLQVHIGRYFRNGANFPAHEVRKCVGRPWGQGRHHGTGQLTSAGAPLFAASAACL